MSEVCQQLIAFQYDLQLIHRDGLDLVEATRKASSVVSQKIAGQWLLKLSRSQDEAVAYLRSCQPQYLTQRMWEIEYTLTRLQLSQDEEAALIYEFCDVAHQAGLGPAISSDGVAWGDLRN